MTLVINELTYVFPDSTVVGPLTFGADSGVVHISGANGSGKTTLMRALGGVLPASSGTVRLDGRDPFQDAAVRAHIGACSPSPELPGFLTATEAWQHWAAFRGRPDWDGQPLLDALDLPTTLRLDQMSSGQRRRAELISALAGDPHLILLDETFTHLDDAGVSWLIQRVQKMRHQHVVVMAHHGPLPLQADQTIHLAPAQRP